MGYIVGGGVFYNAFPGCLVEGLVVDVADVGDQRDLVGFGGQSAEGQRKRQHHDQGQKFLHGYSSYLLFLAKHTCFD